MKFANKRKDELRKQIRQLRQTKMKMRDIAKEVGLPDRQWVYYYLRKD